MADNQFTVMELYALIPATIHTVYLSWFLMRHHSKLKKPPANQQVNNAGKKVSDTKVYICGLSKVDSVDTVKEFLRNTLYGFKIVRMEFR